jgi:hypothetical protein
MKKRVGILDAILFESDEKLPNTNTATMKGYIVDFESVKENEKHCEESVNLRLDAKDLQRSVSNLANEMGLERPLMVVDVGPFGNFKFLHQNKPVALQENEKDLERAPVTRFVMSCKDIVDLTAVENVMGHKVVKVNISLPHYIVFHAANVLLAASNKQYRVMPFPLEDEQMGEIGYHLLAVEKEEFSQYISFMKEAVRQTGSVKRGMEVASKLSYYFLRKRAGTKKLELSNKQVDDLMIHCMVKKDLSLKGILIRNSHISDFNGANISFNIHL